MGAEDARKLFVGGLSDTTTEQGLREVFEGAGFNVVHLALPRDRDTGRARGFAFVTLSTDEQAVNARSQLTGTQLDGRSLTVREFSQQGPNKRAGPGGARPPRDDESTVFLGRLPFDATPEEITQLFDDQGVGPVSRITLPSGPDGRPRGFGFATLGSADAATQAVEKVNGSSLRGRQIVVSPAQPRGRAGPGGGPGGPRESSGPGGGGGTYSRTPYDRGPRPPRDSGPSEPGFDPFSPPPFPPSDDAGGRRRRTGAEGKGRKESKRRGSGGAATGGRAERRERGGARNWSRWNDDD